MKRRIIQILSTIVSNSYIQGFLNSTIYKGKLKSVCVPGLNCYSCPGAIGSCPIGSLQAISNSKNFSLSLFVLGFLMAFGIVFGRLACGFLCPFGFLQDLLYKIKLKKIKIKKKYDKKLRWIKYIILVVFVFLLPVFLTDRFGLGSPYFCKLICPVGTLEGGIPLLLGNEGLRVNLGWLFGWKSFVLVATLVMSVFIYRFFCKYLCPLGAIYSLFNKYSFYQLKIDPNTCIDCKRCEKVCKMNVEVLSDNSRRECILCGDCEKVCPTNALTISFKK